MGLLLLCRPSEVRSLENMASASGKLGGVAGVLLGVHICRERRRCGEGCLQGPRALYSHCSAHSFNRIEAPLSPPAPIKTKNKGKHINLTKAKRALYDAWKGHQGYQK